MKELTTEEKAKAYDKALEIARHYHTEMGDNVKCVLEEVFSSELREGEDEDKIMIRIIEDAICTNEAQELVKTKYGLELTDLANWLEKQGEKKSSDEVLKIRQEVYQSGYKDGYKHGCADTISEQNTTDKTKPKFKIGDWVVSEFTGSVYQIKDCIENLSNHKCGYGLTNGGYIAIGEASYYHLWTIEDAKDGDVLVSKFKQPFIYNGNYNEYSIGAYCGILCDGSMFIETDGVCQWAENKEIKPATKEQRDALMEAMAEAGYTFDFDKKELKKIYVIDEGKAEMDYCFTKMMNGEKVSSAWSEEDEHWRQKAVDFIRHPDLIKATPTLAKDTIKWLKSIKDRYTWKPSDEQMDVLLSEVTAWTKGCPKQKVLESLYNDLKNY